MYSTDICWFLKIKAIFIRRHLATRERKCGRRSRRKYFLFFRPFVLLFVRIACVLSYFAGDIAVLTVVVLKAQDFFWVWRCIHWKWLSTSGRSMFFHLLGQAGHEDSPWTDNANKRPFETCVTTYQTTRFPSQNTWISREANCSTHTVYKT